MEDKAGSIVKQKNIKARVFFSILIIVFSIGLVTKTFQNDTFFNITIGKYITENGIDMKDHFAWHENLYYTYSHWAFDVTIYLIYKFFNFTGIYIGVIILAVIINLVLFNLLTNRTKRPTISAILTLLISFLNGHSYTARSQIVSFLCFIIEIYFIEQYIDTSKTKYAFGILILSIIVANFHAATWPLTLILFMPYLAAAFLNLISSKNIYMTMAKIYEKKYNKYKRIDEDKAEQYKKDYEDYIRLSNNANKKLFSKIEHKDFYNGKRLLILFIITCFTGLITPIHDVPYTYIINSMLGKSNLGNHLSIDYIQEMQSLIPISNYCFIGFSIIFFSTFTFLPTKIKTEHSFLILGLTIMALCSTRYALLLCFIGSFVLADLITQAVEMFIPNEIDYIDKKCTHPIAVILLTIPVVSFSLSNFIEASKAKYIDEESYPVAATEYILENIDYENMRIYNQYENGSYLMFNNIKVFIDSRLDVYCSEFANVDIFKDYIYAEQCKLHYNDLVEKYDITHLLVKVDSPLYTYINIDSDYEKLYEDEYFALYTANKNVVN